MTETPLVNRIEIVHFEWPRPRGEFPPHPGLPHASAIRIHTDKGVMGEYVGGWPLDHDAVAYLAHLLLGQNALDREGLYARCKLAARQNGRVGHSVIDVALWDLAGKWHNAPVYELLGAAHRRLPTYASTFPGDSDPSGLGTPDAYAAFAEQCYELGYRAFKLHGWMDGDVEREVGLVVKVAEQVGDRMVLMEDVSSTLTTFGQAVRLGHVLDEYRFFWYEDPYADTGISSTGNKRLRERIRTPLLITEHLRSLEPKMDFLVNGGTDFLRADPDYDGGITGVIKIAHAAEGLGADVELHSLGPAHRHCMTAIVNTNYYEMALLHPKFDFTTSSTGVAFNYRDGLDAVEPDGCVTAPTGPGLGVEYDWDLIEKSRVGGRIWQL